MLVRSQYDSYEQQRLFLCFLSCSDGPLLLHLYLRFFRHYKRPFRQPGCLVVLKKEERSCKKLETDTTIENWRKKYEKSTTEIEERWWEYKVNQRRRKGERLDRNESMGNADISQNESES